MDEAELRERLRESAHSLSVPAPRVEHIVRRGRQRSISAALTVGMVSVLLGGALAWAVVSLFPLGRSITGVTGGDEVERSNVWGPLAVVPAPAGFGEALIQGTLQVTEECVFLDEQGENVILVWPADRTTWNAETRTITFENLDGETVTLGAGDEVGMSGGGSAVNEDGVPNEEWAAGIDWVSPPAASCLTDTRWFVAEAQPIG
jgi:hypothetical protein